MKRPEDSQDQADAERQRQEHEEQMWRDHYYAVRELEGLLDEMGVPHTKVKERDFRRTARKTR